MELLVCGVWVWAAIETSRSLRFLTSNTIPFPKRTIWLVKILALIVGAAGVMGALSEIGLAWYFAAVPAAAVVFLALKEKVEEVLILRPPPTRASYLPAWESYRRLRRNVLLSYGGIAVSFVGVILASMFEGALPAPVEKSILVLLGLTFLGVLANLYRRLWKFSHWPCPRCGSSFRGLWGFPWLPKRCRYCGLGRWEENPNMTRENNETGPRHNLDKVKRAGGTPALRNGSFTGNASEVCGEGRLSIRPMFNGFGAWAL